MYWKRNLQILAIFNGLIFALNVDAQEPGFDASKELLQIQSLLISEAEMDTIVNKVLRSSYTLRMADAQIAALNEEVKIERKSWMKSFSVGINLFGFSVTPSSIEGASNTTQVSVLSNAAVTLLVNPFEFMSQKNRMKKAKYTMTQQQMAMSNARREIKIFIVKKFLDYQAALESYILSENNLMISNELKHVADEDFKRGAISNAEYNQILAGVMQNRQNLLQTENVVIKLKYELEILMND